MHELKAGTRTVSSCTSTLDACTDCGIAMGSAAFEDQGHRHDHGDEHSFSQSLEQALRSVAGRCFEETNTLPHVLLHLFPHVYFLILLRKSQNATRQYHHPFQMNVCNHPVLRYALKQFAKGIATVMILLFATLKAS